MSAIWHDVECGAYTADLPLWEELARETGGPVLDLGCGTGRVALHLARRGHEVVGLDADAALVAACNERAAGLPAHAKAGDARNFELQQSFALAIAPMQLVQLLGDAAERKACLARVAHHLRPGGRAALALAENVLAGTNRSADGTPTEPVAVPDSREVDGWVWSSLPLETALTNGEIVVRRLRQTVSPSGELSETLDEVRLAPLDAATLEREAEAAGLRRAGRRQIPPTDDHVGSTVVLLEREA